MSNRESPLLPAARLCFFVLSLCAAFPGAQASTNDDLLLAVGSGDGKEVSRLLSKGADANARDEWGFTPLHYANRQVAEVLIDKGADVNARDYYGDTPLHVAARGDKDAAEILMAHGADVNARDDYGESPLYFAAQWGQAGIAEILIANGAEINARDNGGVTPLHVSINSLLIEQPALSLIKLLAAKGADVNARDEHGRTPLHFAAYLGNRDIAEILISRGADVNAKDIDGYTPYGAASRRDVAELLLARGAHPQDEGSLGRDHFYVADSTKLTDSALGKKHAEMRQLLCKSGAGDKSADDAGEKMTILMQKISLKDTFAIISDFSGRKIVVADSVTWTGPVRYCDRPWRRVVQSLVDKHHLSLETKDGTMYISGR